MDSHLSAHSVEIDDLVNVRNAGVTGGVNCRRCTHPLQALWRRMRVPSYYLNIAVYKTAAVKRASPAGMATAFLV